MAGIKTQQSRIEIVDTSASPETFNTIGGTRSFSGPSGSRQVIDATVLASTGREKNVGIPDFGQVTFQLRFSTDSSDYQVSDALSLWTNFKSGDEQTFRIVIPTSPENWVRFTAFVLNFSINSDLDNIIMADATLEITGTPTDSF